jgi:hypothetical protein
MMKHLLADLCKFWSTSLHQRVFPGVAENDSEAKDGKKFELSLRTRSIRQAIARILIKLTFNTCNLPIRSMSFSSPYVPCFSLTAYAFANSMLVRQSVVGEGPLAMLSSIVVPKSKAPGEGCEWWYEEDEADRVRPTSKTRKFIIQSGGRVACDEVHLDAWKLRRL